MKKLFLSISFLILGSLFIMSFAQTEKKIIIKKKTVDSNGTETVEEIILTGEDAKNIDINEYINEGSGIQDIDVDINIEKLTEISENIDLSGENLQIFKFDGTSLEDIIRNNVEVSDEFKEKLKNLKLEELGAKIGERKIIIMSDGDMILDEDLDEILDGSEFQWNGSETFNFRSCTEKGDPTAFLGVWPGELSDAKGVVLGGISEKSAAEKAGLQEGDIITNIGGKAVKTFSELAVIIKEYKPNDKVVIQYIRNNEARSVEVTLGKREEDIRISYFDEDMDHNFSFEDNYTKGNHFSPCCNHRTEVEKAYIGIMIMNDDEGVRIHMVNREDDILNEGDIVVKFGKTDIKDIDQLIDEVSKYNPGDKVKVQYQRDGKLEKVKVRLLGRMVKECCKDPDCCKDEKEIKETVEIIIKKNDDREIKSDLGNSILELQDVNLFPNPSDGVFKLEFTSTDLSPLNIVITDSSGREIIKDEISDFNGKYAGDFNLKGNTPGLYLVNISQNGKVLTKKMIIK